MPMKSKGRPSSVSMALRALSRARTVSSNFMDGRLTCDHCVSIIEGALKDEFERNRHSKKMKLIGGGELKKALDEALSELVRKNVEIRTYAFVKPGGTNGRVEHTALVRRSEPTSS